MAAPLRRCWMLGNNVCDARHLLLGKTNYLPCRTLQQKGTGRGKPSAADKMNPKQPQVDKEVIRFGRRSNEAMRYYLQVATKQATFMNEHKEAFELGKRHLANIMGKDPENFDQHDIDSAVEYLLPSALFNKKARPMMKPPAEYIPQLQVAQFGMDGRPFSPFFYTGFPAFYKLMHEVDTRIEQLKAYEDDMIRKGLYARDGSKPHVDAILTAGSVWVSKENLEKLFLEGEKITDNQYKHFTQIMERLLEQPFANEHKDFLMKYKVSLTTKHFVDNVKPLMYKKDGTPFRKASGNRKATSAHVTVLGNGSGLVTVNGKRFLDAFPRSMDREQIMCPMQFVGMLLKVDVEATTKGPPDSPASMAGAIRLGITKALLSFVEPEMHENLRIAGFLTRDPRYRERNKPGQPGARKKPVWKAR